MSRLAASNRSLDPAVAIVTNVSPPEPRRSALSRNDPIPATVAHVSRFTSFASAAISSSLTAAAGAASLPLAQYTFCTSAGSSPKATRFSPVAVLIVTSLGAPSVPSMTVPSASRIGSATTLSIPRENMAAVAASVFVFIDADNPGRRIFLARATGCGPTILIHVRVKSRCHPRRPP